MTLKAGSTYYKCDGNFTKTTTSQDYSITNVSNGARLVFFTGSGFDIPSVIDCNSGTSEPTTGNKWFNTSNNILYSGSSGNWQQRTNYSLPLAIITVSDGTITSIDQVFNGFGYIGSTVFALPGVKVQAPNGRNEDGTYRITPYSTQNVIAKEVTGTGVKDITIQPNGVLNWVTGGVYLAEDGYLCNHTDGGINISAVLARVLITTAGKIDSFVPRNVDSVANSNASNFSQAGRSYLSGLGMPSSRYIDLTLGASGSTYTAPANGWFYFLGRWVDAVPYLQMRNTTISGLEPRVQTCGASTTGYWGLYMPVRSGDSITINYNAAPVNVMFAFIYAQGEQ